MQILDLESPAQMVMIAVFSPLLVIGVIYWSLLLSVKQILIESHPDSWRGLTTTRWWWNEFGVVQAFVWKRRERTLDDPELSSKAELLRLMRLVCLAGFAVWGVIVFHNLR